MDVAVFGFGVSEQVCVEDVGDEKWGAHQGSISGAPNPSPPSLVDAQNPCQNHLGGQTGLSPNCGAVLW